MSTAFSTFMQTKMAQWAMLVFGLGIGATFPDMDRQIPMLVHRSIVTHGLILPILLFVWIRLRPQLQGVRTFSVGLCATVATHLSFDLFPGAWQGFALIHIPGYGRMSAEFSWGWIMISMVGCAYLAAFYMLSSLEIVVSIGGIILTILAEREPWMRPVIALVVAIGLAEGVDWTLTRLLERVRQHRDSRTHPI